MRRVCVCVCVFTVDTYAHDTLACDARKFNGKSVHRIHRHKSTEGACAHRSSMFLAKRKFVSRTHSCDSSNKRYTHTHTRACMDIGYMSLSIACFPFRWSELKLFVLTFPHRLFSAIKLPDKTHSSYSSEIPSANGVHCAHVWLMRKRMRNFFRPTGPSIVTSKCVDVFRCIKHFSERQSEQRPTSISNCQLIIDKAQHVLRLVATRQTELFMIDCFIKSDCSRLMRDCPKYGRPKNSI